MALHTFYRLYLLIGFYALVLFVSDFSYNLLQRSADKIGQLSGQLLVAR